MTATALRRVAAALAALALALAAAGCSLRAGDDETKTVTEPAVAPSGPVEVQKTPGKAWSGMGTKGGFDPPGISKRLSPGVVTVSALQGSPEEGGLGTGFVVDGQG